MRIATIKLLDFKGLSGTYDLARVNLIAGPNGSGKTAILQALRFAVSGHCGLGKTLEASAQLAGPRGMSVCVELSDGFNWTRAIEIDSRIGSCKMTLVVGGVHGTALRDHEAALSKHVGSFAPMFDVQEFLGLSDDKRRDLVLGLASDSSRMVPDRAELTQRIIHAVTNSYLPYGVPENAPAVLADVADCVTARVLPRDGMERAVACLIEEAKTQTNMARAAKDEAHAAIRRLSEQKSGLDAPAFGLGHLLEMAKALDVELGDLRQKIGESNGRSAARENLQKQAEKKRRSLDGLRRMLNDLSEPAASPEELEKMRREAAELRAMQRPDEDDELRTKLYLLRERDSKAKVADDDAVRAYENLCDELNREKNILFDLQNSPWATLVELGGLLQAEIDELPWHLRVRFADHVLRLQNIAEAHVDMAMIDAVSKRIDTLGDAIQTAKLRRETTKTAYGSAHAALLNAEAAASEFEANYKERRAEWVAAQDRATELEKVIGAVQLAEDARQRDLEKTQADLETATAEALEIENSLMRYEAEGGQADIENLNAELVGKTHQKAALEAQIERKRKYQTTDEQLTIAIAASEAQAIRWEVGKRVQDAVKQVRNELLRELTDPMLRHCNAFLEEAAPDLRAYIDTGDPEDKKPVFEIGGIIREQQYWAFDSLSGREQTLIGAAMTHALVTLADPPLKLLLVELDAVQAVDLHDVVDGIDRAATMQVVCAGHALGSHATFGGGDRKMIVLPPRAG